MRNRFPFRFDYCSAILCIVAVTTTLLNAQLPGGENQEQQQIDTALQLTREAAKKYEFRLSTGSQPPVLREQPILHWSNPERGQIYGNVFLWTHLGRPVVVGSLFKWFSPFTHTSHEFHSLSDGSLSAKFSDAKSLDTEVWVSKEPGITFAPIRESPRVAGTPAARLTQMRQLARQFTVRRTERDGQKNEMRLLPQPVYRYEPSEKSAEPFDGALFVFVQGTDPELWLLFEADLAPEGSGAAGSTWSYAVARMNSTAFTIEYRGQQVAQFDTLPFAEVFAHQSKYTSFQFNLEAVP